MIKPSRDAQKRHRHTIRDTLRSMRGSPQERVIKKLNPIIKGWSLYYTPQVSSLVFNRLDHDMFYKLWRWACFRHPNKAKGWIKRKYFRAQGQDHWRFKTHDHKTLVRHSDFPIKRHIKVVGARSLYDGDWVYWATRLGRSLKVSQWVARLLKKQQGRCGQCRLWFTVQDLLEVHHLDRIRQNNKIDNLLLLHRHCHDDIHKKRYV